MVIDADMIDTVVDSARLLLCIPLAIIFASMVVMAARYARQHDTRMGLSMSLGLFSFGALQFNLSEHDKPLTRNTLYIALACVPALWSIWKEYRFEASHKKSG